MTSKNLELNELIASSGPPGKTSNTGKVLIAITGTFSYIF